MRKKKKGRIKNNHQCQNDGGFEKHPPVTRFPEITLLKIVVDSPMHFTAKSNACWKGNFSQGVRNSPGSISSLKSTPKKEGPECAAL